MFSASQFPAQNDISRQIGAAPQAVAASAWYDDLALTAYAAARSQQQAVALHLRHDLWPVRLACCWVLV